MHLLIVLSLVAVVQLSLEEVGVVKKSYLENKAYSVDGTSLELQKEILDKHNEFRRGVRPTARNMLKMSWNEKAAKNARKWANQCNASLRPKEERTVDGVYCGEILFLSMYARSWSDVIEQWHSKVSNFKYGVETVDPTKSFGGYTQIVWYNSHQIGCAVAYCPSADFPFLYLCQYCPSGNLVGKLTRPYKEGPSCGDCPNNCEDKLCTNPCPYVDKILNCEDLKKQFSCTKQMLQNQCEATCKCKTEIK